jgi:hypothetical protein
LTPEETMKLWEPGKVIVIREVWQNKVYSAIPLRVVQDSTSWAALYLPPQTRCLWPHTLAGETIRIPTAEWVLDGEAWSSGDILYLIKPGSGYTVIGFWDAEHVFDHWKINLEEPMRRTQVGFDYMDQILDIVVSADRSAWQWKDEDEVREAQARGIFTAEQVNELYQRGERIIETLRNNQTPFDGGWEKWTPNPAWRTPLELPPGWERL